jgi:acetolactate synthase-1/2/3 large subunit
MIYVSEAWNSGLASRIVPGIALNTRETTLNGADVLVDRLCHHGVRTVFGMPGSHSTAIYDAIVRDGRIRTILVRNEQAGAFLADGYSRVTGQPGVLCTTAGPGATNALTGIGEAWADSVPLLLIGGQVDHDRIEQECGNYHEIDLEAIFKPCTKYVATVMEHDQIVPHVDYAFTAMQTGRPRPTAIFLPKDLAAAEVRDSAMIEPTNSDIEVSYPETDLDRAAELLLRCRRPILLAGGGAVTARAGAELEELARRLDAPVITTLNGKGILDERHPLSLGHARSARARVALAEADGMLAIGCRFTEVMTGFRNMKVPKRLIQIDVDRKQIGINHPIEIGIVADARLSLHVLKERIPENHQTAWGRVWEAARMTTPPKPEWFIHTLRAELPEDGIVFTDASEMAYRMHTDFETYAPRTFFYPSNYIALGWGFPAALGAAVAFPDRPIVSVSGDGGFQMTAQELATAVRYQLKVIAIIHNDGAYGAIKHGQQKHHGGRFIDTELNNPDFVRLAEAYDVPARRAPDARSFAEALREALERRGPSLIEVPDEWRNLRV